MFTPPKPEQRPPGADCGAAFQASSALRYAASYVRMSTEHQKYSIANQIAAIELYAKARGFTIVRTYADRGRSGLTLSGRLALQALLADIENNQADYEAVLVYDVSRWGRFPDPDEAASVELRCRRAGIAIHYCAEQFENDGSLGSAIIKSVKRVMAGEYSRELSVKVFAGQSRVVELGFWQGGAAGYGLRRMPLDHSGKPKPAFSRGEHKNVTTDRVTLVPGPHDETEVVREIYHHFTAGGLHEGEIADLLNARHVPTGLGAGRLWTRQIVRKILTSEKYVGNNVWGRTSFKLQQVRVVNSKSQWVRADGVFTPIVPTNVFRLAQAKVASRRRHIPDQQLLDHLRKLLGKTGYVSASLVNRSDGPSAEQYRKRFGSIRRAYALIGYHPQRDFKFLDLNRRLRAVHAALEAELMRGITAAGGQVERGVTDDLLLVNHEYTVRVAIARALKTQRAKSLRWRVTLEDPPDPDFIILARMDAENEGVRDFYILPRMSFERSMIYLSERNPHFLDVYRCASLQLFYKMARRRLVQEETQCPQSP